MFNDTFIERYPSIMYETAIVILYCEYIKQNDNRRESKKRFVCKNKKNKKGF